MVEDIEEYSGVESLEKIIFDLANILD